MSQASYILGNRRGARYSGNNFWNVNLNIGNLNNNNTYNRYFTVGASELWLNEDEWLQSETNSFKNKHSSIEATYIHFHLGLVLLLMIRVHSGEWKPDRSYCFVLAYPVLREIFAAFPLDRLVHHYVAPFIVYIAECVHMANGDVSHGNRIGHSARTAAAQVERNIGKWKYVIRIDFRGFFISINRRLAYETLEGYARTYYEGYDIDEKLAICKLLILSNPAENCVKKGDLNRWGLIDTLKSMFYARAGCGLPIGKFYSQLIANLFLAIIDAAIKEECVDCTRLVDDITFFANSIEQANHIKKKIIIIAERIGLIIHQRKYYIQPSHRGVAMCGYVIKGNMVYLNNRTIHACKRKIVIAECTELGAKSICCSINSYFGLMKHCTERKMEKKIADLVLKKFGRWLYFKIDNGHFTCYVKKCYTDKYISVQQINTYKNAVREIYKWAA